MFQYVLSRAKRKSTSTTKLCAKNANRVGYRKSFRAGGRVVGPVEGAGVRQAVSKHHLHSHARHTTSEAGSHAAYAGEHAIL